MKYDFTGKERDQETSYDYFGARYYDSRIGRWGGVEPLLDNNISFTPYNYCRNNPVILIDPNGAWDEYVNESGEYLGSDNDPNSNEVRVIKKEEWENTSSRKISDVEKRIELQTRGKLLKEYQFGIPISASTWSILESKGVTRLLPYVANRSDYTIWYKPEEGGDLPWPVSPQSDLYTPIDGLNTPTIETDKVYKVPTGYRTWINEEGEPNIIGIPESINFIYGEVNAPDQSGINLRDVYK